MKRRTFVKNAFIAGATAAIPFESIVSVMEEQKKIQIVHTHSGFEREKLVRAFGFKGGYLTELWQTAVQLKSEKHSTIGISTQSALYGDADLFASFSEAGSNAMMYALTENALQLAKQVAFTTPFELAEKTEQELMKIAIRTTGKQDLNINFLLNAMIGVDNAAWLLYAAENGLQQFDTMLPAQYRKALSFRNNKVAVMFQVSYAMPVEDISKAADNGYFLIKIKIGQAGTQEEMLQKDIARLTLIHNTLKEKRTAHTPNGKLIYTMDANGRYDRKETLQRYIDHAKKIGALEQVLFIEEPFPEKNEEHVGDLGIRIGADESIHDEMAAKRRISQGYGLMVLKGIAKTVTRTLQIARLAYENNIPCICADLTVNPVLIDWNKNFAARVAPFPGLGMGMIETNGDMNYQHWEAMLGYHPAAGASWTKVQNGVFELDEDFYKRSGAIFESSPHYREIAEH